MEYNRAVNIRNAALIAAVAHTPLCTAQHTPRMQQPRRFHRNTHSGGETENIRVKDNWKPSPRPMSQVHTYNTGHSAAVRIQCEGCCVFCLQGEHMVVIKLNNTGIVLKYTDQPGNTLRHGIGNTF